jgi:hypothetical protein
LFRQGPAKTNATKLNPNLPWCTSENQHLNTHRRIVCKASLIPARFVSAPYTNEREQVLPVQLSSLLYVFGFKVARLNGA